MDKSFPMSIPRRNPVSSGHLAMLLIIGAEIMFFAGLVSAYIVNRSVADEMPDLHRPALPAELTALNTLFLVASLFPLLYFSMRLRSGKKSRALLLITLLLGTTFLVLQGAEWINLIRFGFTTSSSIYGAFFYTIIGAHAAHVIAGLILLLYLLYYLRKPVPSETAKNRLTIISLYWYFVVIIWPVLYVMVYLT